MTTATQNDIQTSFRRHRRELRACFQVLGTDAEGFAIDDLDALEAAIQIARRQLADDGGEPEEVATPVLTLGDAFTQQQDRLPVDS